MHNFYSKDYAKAQNFASLIWNEVFTLWLLAYKDVNNMLLSLIEAYAPHLKLTYCEEALCEVKIILLVCQHVYPLIILRDTVT